MRRIRDYAENLKDPGEWEDWLRRCRIPSGYWHCSPSQISKREVREFVEGGIANIKSWLGNGMGFYLHGPFNSGKSALAAILAMDAARRAERVLWLSVRDLASVRFRETPEFAAVNDALYHCDLLVVDDLGAERFRLTGAAGAALEEAIRIPYDRSRSVIVTSNISWGDFPVHYAEIDGFVSVLKRRIYPFAVVNDQWPDGPGTPW